MRLTAETTQLTCELVLFLLQHSFKHFVLTYYRVWLRHL